LIEEQHVELARGIRHRHAQQRAPAEARETPGTDFALDVEHLSAPRARLGERHGRLADLDARGHERQELARRADAERGESRSAPRSHTSQREQTRGLIEQVRALRRAASRARGHGSLNARSSAASLRLPCSV
jgi:hypothetical protein